ncbi:MAG: DUF922 domain-containing protein [Candidatus Binatia bacterium]
MQKSQAVSHARRSIALFYASAWLCASVVAGAEITVRADPPVLTWSAFRSVESLAESEDAHIAAEISFPRPLRMESADGVYRLPAFTITVAPEPARTRVRRSAQRSAALLRHEQGHYDIVVLAARALGRELASITASSASDLSRAVEDCVAKHTERAARSSEAYDRETDHGRSLSEQTRWSARIAAALTAETVGELLGMPL